MRTYDGCFGHRLKVQKPKMAPGRSGGSDKYGSLQDGTAG
jgi:hypothetical protein